MGKVYYNETKIIIDDMKRIYGPDDLDWMSYLITVRNVLTYHHIIKECDGGLLELSNGALLTKKAHRLLNMTEIKDYNLYLAWNELFKEINKRKEPMDDYLREESKSLKLHTHKLIYGGEF